MEKNDLELMKIIKKYNYIGVSVLHAKKDGADLYMHDGLLDKETKEPITDGTIFRIASISKVIVALGIMKLYEQGKVKIDEDISNYLGYTVRNPLYPNEIITLEQLMTQTSSINDNGTDGHGYDGVNGPTYEISLKRMLTDPTYEHYCPETFSKYHPWQEWRYSNFGCGILACIIESVTGRYFTDFIREELLLPLGLDASFRAGDIVHYDDIASLYEYDPNKKDFIKERDKELFIRYMFPKYPLGNNFRGPAGGLFINPMDLSKIMRMMMNKGIVDGVRLFKEETINFMEQIHWKGYSYDPNYKAKGLQLCLMDGISKKTLKGHTGYAYGLRSFMFYNDTDGYIFMCNGADYGSFMDHMSRFQEEVLTYLVRKYENE